MDNPAFEKEEAKETSDSKLSAVDDDLYNNITPSQSEEGTTKRNVPAKPEEISDGYYVEPNSIISPVNNENTTENNESQNNSNNADYIELDEILKMKEIHRLSKASINFNTINDNENPKNHKEVPLEVQIVVEVKLLDIFIF